MNKKIILLSGILVFVILLFIGIKLIDSSSKTLELTYKTNGGVPYKWEYEIEDEEVVKFIKSYVVKDENKNGKVGAPIYTNYVFKGLKKGTTTIKFKYISIVDQQEIKEEVINIKVDGNKNISMYYMLKD